MHKNNQNIGLLGENIVVRFLMKQGFLVVCRNFRAKYGELDLVARKGSILYFFEVKTVSYETLVRPEENVHYRKRRKIAKTIELFLMKHANGGVVGEVDWKFYAVNVRLDRSCSTYQIYFLGDTLA